MGYLEHSRFSTRERMEAIIYLRNHLFGDATEPVPRLLYLNQDPWVDPRNGTNGDDNDTSSGGSGNGNVNDDDTGSGSSGNEENVPV